MQIFKIVRIWWTFLYEAITSIFAERNRLTSSARNLMKLEPRNKKPLVNEPMDQWTMVGCIPENGISNQLVCREIFHPAEITIPKYVGSSLAVEPVNVVLNDSGSQDAEICSGFIAPIQSDDENDYDHRSAVHSTSSERKVLSNTLKELIENVESSESTKRPIKAMIATSKNIAAINLAYCISQVIEGVAKTLGMKVTTHGKDWDVIWYSRPISGSRCASFSKYQRVNYFPECQKVVWKHNLAMFMTKMWKIFPQEYDFFPKSWVLPMDWHLMDKYARKCPKEWYIVKPNDRCGGQGIYLTNEITKLSNCRQMISQVYVKRPLLIDGLKFDLRIYVLVTSCKPLRIFVYNEGLARFATEKYQVPDRQNKTNQFMHLTNYAVNKHSSTYIEDETKGTLRRWTTVAEWLNEHEINVKSISALMDDIIIKTVIAMTPTLKHHYFKSFPDQTESNSCFQIFGFDILFGDDLKVYVLEVNGSPQLRADVPLDVEMTRNLVQDTFNILNLAEKPFDLRTHKTNLWLVKHRESRATTRRRIKRENSHLGNFRKIYPNRHNKYYKKFINAAEHFIHT